MNAADSGEKRNNESRSACSCCVSGAAVCSFAFALFPVCLSGSSNQLNDAIGCGCVCSTLRCVFGFVCLAFGCDVLLMNLEGMQRHAKVSPACKR